MGRGINSSTLLYLKEGNTVAEKNNNATCCICGREYHKCLSCKDSMRLQPWKSVTDNADCYKVFQVVKGFSTGVYSKDEFKSKLKNIDLSNLEGFKDNIKTLIKDALKEEPVVEKVEEPVVVKAVEEIQVPRKRNYKINKVEVE